MEFEPKHQNSIPQKCPMCNAKEDMLTVLPVAQAQERMTMHVSCEKCSSAVVVFITQNDVGMMTFGVIVDVQGAEAQTFFNENPVGDDEVIEVHRYMQADKAANVHDIITC